MERQYKVLIVDPSPVIRDDYSNVLRGQGFEVVTAIGTDAGWQWLQQGQFDVALIAPQRPDFAGLDLIRQAKSTGIDTSFIVIAGPEERDQAVDALNAGVAYWFDTGSGSLNELGSKVLELAEVIPLAEVARILSAIPDRD